MTGGIVGSISDLSDGKQRRLLGGMMAGFYRSPEAIAYHGLYLTPVSDHSPVFGVLDGMNGATLGVINAGACTTARELRAEIEAMYERVDVDAGGAE